jgi:hypothetical protein
LGLLDPHAARAPSGFPTPPHFPRKISVDSEAEMRRKLVIYCEACGGERLSGREFIVYHHLGFCSADCRDEYRTADDLRRARCEEAAGKAA